jgi:glycosyltransferase involved in cell wall biosynthesis
MEKMNVLYVFTFNYSLKTWSDSGTMSREIERFKYLNQKYGIEFTLLTYGTKLEFGIIGNIPGIKIIPIFEKASKPQGKLQTIFKSLLFLIKNKEKFKNISVIKQNQLNGVWVSIFLKFLLKKPMIYRSGYDTYRFSKFENKTFLKRTFFFLITNLTFICSDLITVTSNSDLKYSKNKYAAPNKIIVRRNWVEIGDNLNFEKRFDKRILVIGRLEDQKNIEKIINDFRDSKFTIDIIGSGSQLLKLKKISVEQDSKVNFLGTVDNSELSKIYSKYKYFISTSYFEGNPKTVLEAMANGCVVLISRIDNHLELVDDGVNGFIEDLNVDFNEVIVKILDSDINLSTISNNALKKVSELNSLEKICEQEYGDFSSLINQKKTF